MLFFSFNDNSADDVTKSFQDFLKKYIESEIYNFKTDPNNGHEGSVTKEVVKKLALSQMMMSFINDQYLASDYCRKEILLFKELQQDVARLLIVDLDNTLSKEIEENAKRIGKRVANRKSANAKFYEEVRVKISLILKFLKENDLFHQSYNPLLFEDPTQENKKTISKLTSRIKNTIEPEIDNDTFDRRVQIFSDGDKEFLFKSKLSADGPTKHIHFSSKQFNIVRKVSNILQSHKIAASCFDEGRKDPLYDSIGYDAIVEYQKLFTKWCDKHVIVIPKEHKAPVVWCRQKILLIGSTLRTENDTFLIVEKREDSEIVQQIIEELAGRNHFLNDDMIIEVDQLSEFSILDVISEKTNFLAKIESD